MAKPSPAGRQADTTRNVQPVGVSGVPASDLSLVPETHLVVATIEPVVFAPFLLTVSHVHRITTVSPCSWAAGQFAVTDVSGGEIQGIERE